MPATPKPTYTHAPSQIYLAQRNMPGLRRARHTASHQQPAERSVEPDNRQPTRAQPGVLVTNIPHHRRAHGLQLFHAALVAKAEQIQPEITHHARPNFTQKRTQRTPAKIRKHQEVSLTTLANSSA